jgi:SAM-dependent methyltransferase
LLPVLSLGRTPLANALLPEADLHRPELTFPLDLAFCPACSLAQITETVTPDLLFRDYRYFSSYSDTMLRHAAELAERLVRERTLGPDSLVVEAASNDGYLLKNYTAAGVPVLGVEPARNVAAVARANGVPTRDEFFTAELAESLAAEGVWADVFHAHNVLAHVADLPGFVQGVRTVLKPGGVAVIEVPYVRDLLGHNEFDTIYHEHLCYFSLSALDRLFRGRGLTVADAERVPIHGGSLRLFAVPSDTGPSAGERVTKLLQEEQDIGLKTAEQYRAFAGRVGEIKTRLNARLHGLKADGHRIAAYGASAKGSTLLNYCGIGRDVLDFVVDRSAAKQGRFTPGTHLRIFPPEKLLEAMPAYTLLLTWNFADEILAQQAEYTRRGGRFVLPVPDPRVV